MSQLVNAIELLQNKQIMHRDLKPMNVMLDDNYNVKLIDFGDAKRINEKIEEDNDFYEEMVESNQSWEQSPSMKNEDAELPNTIEFEGEDEKENDGEGDMKANDSFEFDKEVLVETDEGNGKKTVKKYKNQYVPMIRERCDTIVGTANYLSPEVIMQHQDVFKG